MTGRLQRLEARRLALVGRALDDRAAVKIFAGRVSEGAASLAPLLALGALGAALALRRGRWRWLLRAAGVYTTVRQVLRAAR